MEFSSDLRRIRESRGLTLEGLHEETKIPLSVLEDFEETGLFDNPMFNRVYLRSLVRTYASYVGIPKKAMLEALDEALLESYKGDLARFYLEEDPAETTEAPPAEAVAAGAPASTEAPSTPEEPAVGEPAADDDGASAEAPVAEAPVMEAPVVEAPASEEPVAEEPTAEDASAEDASAEDASAEDAVAEAPVVEASVVEAPASEASAVDASSVEDTTAAEPPSPKDDTVVKEIQHMLLAGEKARAQAVGAPSSSEEAASSAPLPVSRGRTRPPMLTTAEATRASQEGRSLRPLDVKRRAWYTQWMIIVFAVVGFVAAIWAVLFLIQQPDDTSQSAAVDTAVVDTAAATIAEPPQPRLTLDDTLYVVLLAVEKVERIQIRRDDDLLRAYWIEQGVAKAFPALERIVFENRLDLIRLFVEGFEYPTDIRDEDGRVVITRAGLQTLADTLTTPPVPLPTPPDTIPLWPVRGQ